MAHDAFEKGRGVSTHRARWTGISNLPHRGHGGDGDVLEHVSSGDRW